MVSTVIILAAQVGVRYSLTKAYAYINSNIVGFLNILEACRSTTGIRFFTVYGPWGRPDMALFIFTKKILNGEPIQVFNYGKMKRDFTYIDDIVEGIVRLINKVPNANPVWSGDKPDPGTSYEPYKIYNIGNNQSVELMHFINVLEKALGKEAKKDFLPIQAGDVPETYADVDDLMKDVGFRPKTSIEEGIAKIVKWYKDYYGVI